MVNMLAFAEWKIRAIYITSKDCKRGVTIKHKRTAITYYFNALRVFGVLP